MEAAWYTGGAKPLRGKHTAPDGWLMTWNTDTLPLYIKVFNSKGICQSVKRGLLDDGDVERTKAKFKQEHSGQMRMAL